METMDHGEMTPNFIIDPDKVRFHAKSPHEPPQFNSNFDREKYQDDLWKASKELESLLVNAGFSSSRTTTIDDEYDFYMNDDIGQFRMLSFEINTPKMATKSLIIKIANWLQTKAPDYSVFITNEYDESLELFMIVVTQDTVWGEIEEHPTARVLGFDPNSPLIGPIS